MSKVPGHIGIHGKEVADYLAKSTPTFPHTIPLSLNFLALISSKCYISNLWSTYWSNLPADFVTRYKNIATVLKNYSWFNNLNLPMSTIIQSDRLLTGHTLLPAHAYKLKLNDCLHCTLCHNESVLRCPSLSLRLPSSARLNALFCSIL